MSGAELQKTVLKLREFDDQARLDRRRIIRNAVFCAGWGNSAGNRSLPRHRPRVRLLRNFRRR
jgi:hypothetical protein